MSLTQPQLAFLKLAAEAGVKCEKETGLPAMLSVVQACIESAWGKSAPGNNCFGIKNTDRWAGSQYVVTKEFINGTWKTLNLEFETYPTLTDCFNDHARLLTMGGTCYTPHWRNYSANHVYEGLVWGISAHYATDPDYAPLILSMSKMPAILSAIDEVRKVPNA
jgi:flagellum-specific peptidoglycan hydrolase FlgJ